MTLEEPRVCGIAPFTLPRDHEFSSICALLHDPAYENYLKGFYGRPLYESDRAMLSAMLKVAKEKKSLKLRMEAYVFFGLATAFRLVFRNNKKGE